MTHEFDAVLKKLEGKMQWTVFYVPFSVKDLYNTDGRINVKGKIDGHAFKGTLLPSRSGHYMVFNKDLRKVIKKELNDSIHIIMEQDLEPRTIEIPQIIMERLKDNEEVFEKFQNLPKYIKREQIKKIMDAKKLETKNRRIDKLIESLIEK